MKKNLAKTVIFLVTFQRIFEDFIGGEQKFILSLYQWLRSKNYRTVIVGRKLFGFKDTYSNTSSYFIKNNEKNKIVKHSLCLRLPHVINTIAAWFFCLFLSLKIINLNKKVRFSILHAHDSYAGLGCLLASKLLKIPLIMHLHGLRIDTMDRTLKGFWRFMLIYEKFLEILVCKNANLIISVNNAGKMYLERAGINSRKICVIPTGINVGNYDLNNINAYREIIRKDLGLGSDFVIGYVGRFSPEKNIEILIEAFKKIVDDGVKAKLLLIGWGDIGERLKEICREKKLIKSVMFTGVINDIRNYLLMLDTFVLPSRTEGCPISLLEAMASGLPIICSNIPPISEIVQDKKEALLFNPHSVQDLHDKIVLLYQNQELRRKLGENAKKKARQYDFKVVFHKIVEAYSRVLNDSSVDSNITNYALHKARQGLDS